MINFSQKTLESLHYYVYALIDPRNQKIFYVGKGTGNRVFNHLSCAIDGEQETHKLNIIREIVNSGQKVNNYIIRHGLDEDDAFTVESVLIDFLTHSSFSSVANISNIVAGHYQWNKGIKTVDEIETLYACIPLQLEDIRHNIMTININKTYDRMGTQQDLYEATRKYWVLSESSIQKVDYVLGEYRGIIRVIFKPNKWIKDGKRYLFEGDEIIDPEIIDLYLNKSLPQKSKGMANPIRYFYKQNLI